MRYYIFKDGRLVNTTTSRRASIAAIREMQAKEDLYWIKSEFSIIHGDVAGLGLTTEACTEYFILGNGILQCANLHSITDAETVVDGYRKQPNAKQFDYTIIHGKPEELIEYPKRKRSN